jgi:hypothetical protein
MAMSKDKAAVALGKKRWKGKSAEDKRDHAVMMSIARAVAMTPEQRSAVAKQASLARWGKKGAKKKVPSKAKP